MAWHPQSSHTNLHCAGKQTEIMNYFSLLRCNARCHALLFHFGWLFFVAIIMTFLESFYCCFFFSFILANHRHIALHCMLMMLSFFGNEIETYISFSDKYKKKEEYIAFGADIVKQWNTESENAYVAFCSELVWSGRNVSLLRWWCVPACGVNKAKKKHNQNLSKFLQL